MKAMLAATLLLLQLQPVLGAGACARLGRASAQRECTMPEHGSNPVYSVGEPSPHTPQSCALASVCAPAPLAIPVIGKQIVRGAVLISAALIAPTTPPVEVSTAPPFHPPRA
jgi:hypothetical protein